jgi:hypothetical protein
LTAGPSRIDFSEYQMTNNFKWFLYRLSGKVAKRSGNHAKISYSQCGEDLIARFVFDALKISHPTFLDIGAYHPSYLNNTFKFYLEGCRGVNIEADPVLFSKFPESRPEDRNLNIGIGAASGHQPFFLMSTRTLNTFSRVEALAAAEKGLATIEKEMILEVMGIERLLMEYFPNQAPDFVSLDIEGLDHALLSAWDFTRYRPKVFCVETIVYEGNKSSSQRTEILDLFRSAEYFQYAHTSVNGIFVDQRIW